MGPWGPWVPRYKKAQWDQICQGHILETTGPIFMISKPYESPLVPDVQWFGYFSSGAVGLKGTHRAQILSGIQYMLANTGLIFALIIYKGHMVTPNTQPAFSPAPDIICW